MPEQNPSVSRDAIQAIVFRRLEITAGLRDYRGIPADALPHIVDNTQAVLVFPTHDEVMRYGEALFAQRSGAHILGMRWSQATEGKSELGEPFESSREAIVAETDDPVRMRRNVGHVAVCGFMLGYWTTRETRGIQRLD